MSYCLIYHIIDTRSIVRSRGAHFPGAGTSQVSPSHRSPAGSQWAPGWSVARCHLNPRSNVGRTLGAGEDAKVRRQTSWCMGSYGPMGSYGILWDPMGSYGILWDPMGSYGSLGTWPCFSWNISGMTKCDRRSQVWIHIEKQLEKRPSWKSIRV